MKVIFKANEDISRMFDSLIITIKKGEKVEIDTNDSKYIYYDGFVNMGMGEFVKEQEKKKSEPKQDDYKPLEGGEIDTENLDETPDETGEEPQEELNEEPLNEEIIDEEIIDEEPQEELNEEPLNEEIIDEEPQEELDEIPEYSDSMKKDELKSLADKYNIEYNSSDTKSDIIDKLDNHFLK